MSTQQVEPGSEALAIRGLTKSYGAAAVLRGVDLSFRRGEVHALLGPNGAGKSTLLGCLSGAVSPDSGSMTVAGSQHSHFTPASALKHGTSIIYQHFQLIGSLSVADNIFLGSERRRGGTVDFADQRRKSANLLKLLGVDLDPAAPVDSLSVGEQQTVEIVRALQHRPSLLILDEPTAALSTDEIDKLLGLVRRLAHEQNLAVVYVTHLLREVMEVSDKVTILRDGRVLWTRDRSDLTTTDLIRGIAPAGTANSDKRTRSSRQKDPVLQLDGYRSPHTGPVDLTVSAGEIVGVFGLLGSGRTDLLESLAGVRRSAGGAAFLGAGGEMPQTPLRAKMSGIGFVASDRKAQSLFSDMTAVENMMMPHYGMLNHGFRVRRRELEEFNEVGRRVGLVPLRADRNADQFSGGNAQKLVIGRWLSQLRDVRLLILDEPTQGVDIGARRELYDLLREFADGEGRAVLFASSDPEEIAVLADRVVVLQDGRVVPGADSHLGEEALLAMAHGELDKGSERG